MDSKKWLCLYFRDLPVEIFLRGVALDERDTPVVILDRHRVSHQNEAASDLGIEPGNNMDTAYTLSEQVLCFERDTGREAHVLSRLAQWAYQFTPNVSVCSPGDQNYLLLDITGCDRLFNGLDSLERQVTDGLMQLGFIARPGLASTPESSIIAAKYLQSSRDFIYRGPSAGARDDINQLPVTCLEIEHDVAGSLQQMGIRDVRQLFELPRSGLIRRFGKSFADYLDRLTGEKPDPRPFISPTPDFFSEISFLTDVTNISSLIFPIKRLLGELSGFLKGRQLATDRLAWRLSHRSHPSATFSISLANPENDERIFLPLTQLRLDKVDNVAEVDSISLSVKRFVPMETGPRLLFPSSVSGTHTQNTHTQNTHTQNKDRANHLLNMLHARLGAGICFGLSLANDHRPEKAWKLIRVGQYDRWQPIDDEEENPRPLFLLQSPKRLTVVDSHPSLGGKLDLLTGPERIEFGWWDESSTIASARDYYVARQKTGTLLWVFEHLVDKPGWYLHGIFS